MKMDYNTSCNSWCFYLIQIFKYYASAFLVHIFCFKRSVDKYLEIRENNNEKLYVKYLRVFQVCIFMEFLVYMFDLFLNDRLFSNAYIYATQ